MSDLNCQESETVKDLLNQRKIILNEPVTEELIYSIFCPLEELTNNSDKKKPIHLYINSCGGNTYEGLFLASYIMSSKTPIYTYILGTAQSAACAIAVSGHKRFAYRYSQIMMHLPKCESEQSESKNLLSLAKGIAQLDDHILNLFAEKTKLSRTQLNKKFISDYFVMPEQALKEGFVDEIL